MLPPLASQSTALALALGDIQRDFYITLGLAPVIVFAPPAKGAVPPNTTVLYLGDTASAPWLPALVPPACLAGWEAHCVVATTAFGYPAIVATGAGARGAIFGAYSFSELVLGVNPLGLFTDDPPRYQGPAINVADDFAFVKAPPLYTYRAAFTNDEDLLGGLRRSPTGSAVFGAWRAAARTRVGVKARV